MTIYHELKTVLREKLTELRVAQFMYDGMKIASYQHHAQSNPKDNSIADNLAILDEQLTNTCAEIEKSSITELSYKNLKGFWEGHAIAYFNSVKESTKAVQEVGEVIAKIDSKRKAEEAKEIATEAKVMAPEGKHESKAVALPNFFNHGSAPRAVSVPTSNIDADAFTAAYQRLKFVINETFISEISLSHEPSRKHNFSWEIESCHEVVRKKIQKIEGDTPDSVKRFEAFVKYWQDQERGLKKSLPNVVRAMANVIREFEAVVYEPVSRRLT